MTRQITPLLPMPSGLLQSELRMDLDLVCSVEATNASRSDGHASVASLRGLDLPDRADRSFTRALAPGCSMSLDFIAGSNFRILLSTRRRPTRRGKAVPYPFLDD